MPFGQLVVGPPGSGKTTYCAGLQQFYGLQVRRRASLLRKRSRLWWEAARVECVSTSAGAAQAAEPALQGRKCAVVNLDPANDPTSYTAAGGLVGGCQEGFGHVMRPHTNAPSQSKGAPFPCASSSPRAPPPCPSLPHPHPHPPAPTFSQPCPPPSHKTCAELLNPAT